MRRIEKILLSTVPAWIVVVLLALWAAGTVVFGALIEDAATRTAKNFVARHFPDLSNVAIGIARIPKTLHRLSFGSHPAKARRQRFDGQAGLAFADTAHLPETGGGEGYLFLARHLPKPTLDEPEGREILYELIDLNRRKTVHAWQRYQKSRSSSPVFVRPDGALIVSDGLRVMRVDACSNVARWKELESIGHHSIERDADGNFWMPAKSGSHRMSNRKDELLKLASSGDILARISLTDALARNGYRHLLYRIHQLRAQPVARQRRRAGAAGRPVLAARRSVHKPARQLRRPPLPAGHRRSDLVATRSHWLHQHDSRRCERPRDIRLQQ